MYKAQIVFDPDLDIKTATEKFPAAVRAGFNAVCRFHVETILPRHFQPNAKYVYRHTKRSIPYMARKKKQKGHNTDMIWSGRLKNEVLNSSTWTSTKDHGTVHIRGRAFNLRQKRVNMNKEITTFAPKEIIEIENVFTDAFTAGFEKRRTRSSIFPSVRVNTNPITID